MLRILTKMTECRWINTAKNILICASLLFVTACATGPNGQGSNPHSVKPIHTNSNDIWQRIRDNYGMPDLYNDEVAAKESYYASRADYVGRMTDRSADFLYLIMNEIERRHMPSELALLPFVESAFVTSAKSSAKASGLWQFMPSTGRDFSLNQNRFSDQRNDVVASTDAALTYLQRLHDQFGDWHLALAAYNWGEGNVARAVKRSYATGGSGSYQDIKMPAETRQYVPKLQAIKNIVSNPALYGITLPNISNRARHEAVIVTRDIDVSTAAELSGMSEEEFKRLNPAHKKPVIVAAVGSKILVPTERANALRSALSNHSRQLASLTTYTTFSSESLADIAKKYNTDEYRLRELNSIPDNHNYIQANSTLIVPRINKNDEIPYLALNSTVRSSTGGAGFNDGMDQNTGIYLANTTSTATPSNTVAQADTIRAPQNTLQRLINQDTSTGLVAHQDDADNLSELIKNPPSIPVANPVMASNTFNTSANITPKGENTDNNVPATPLAILDSTPAQQTPETVDVENIVATTQTANTLSAQPMDVPSTPTSTMNSSVVMNTLQNVNSTVPSATDLPILENIGKAVTEPQPLPPVIASVIQNDIAKAETKISTTNPSQVAVNPQSNDTGKRLLTQTPATNPSKTVVKTSNHIKSQTAPLNATNKAIETVKPKSNAKWVEVEKNKGKAVAKNSSKPTVKKEDGQTLAKAPLKDKKGKSTPSASAQSPTAKNKTSPTVALSKSKASEKPTVAATKTTKANNAPKGQDKRTAELTKKDSQTKTAAAKSSAKASAKTPATVTTTSSKKDSKTQAVSTTKTKKK